MPSFIVETYVPRLTSNGLDRLVHRLARAAAGTPVDHLRSYFVPEDEMCMHVLASPSAEAVRAVARIAGLEIERIVQSVGEHADPSRRRHA